MYKVKYGRVMWRDDDGLLNVVAAGGTCDPPEGVVERNHAQLQKMNGQDEDWLGSTEKEMKHQTTQMKRSRAATRRVVKKNK